MENRPWHTRYPKNVRPSIETGGYESVAQLLEKFVGKFKDEVAFVNFGKEMTYKRLDELATQFAAYLQGKGLKSGDRIAFQMPNLLQYPVVMFGALKAGLIIVNTNPLYTPREMEHQFRDSGSVAIVILANFARNLQEILDKTDLRLVIITETGDMVGGIKGPLINFVVRKVKKMVPPYKIPGAVTFHQAMAEGSKMTFSPVRISKTDVAFLQYTGGTTGVSMGATLTHENIIANMLQVREYMNPRFIEGDELVITALPLYHIFALTVNFLCMFQLGARNILITNPRDIPGFIKELKKHKFTFISGVNTLFNGLLNNPEFKEVDFSRLRVSVGGGMAVLQSVAERWKKLTNIPLVEGYGLSETAPVLSCNPIDGTEKNGTIGLPLPETDLKVIDDDGKDLAAGHPGEICAKGPQVMKGYWNRDEETKKVFLEGGWMRTGDIGLLQEDGFFKIIDRKKDMILVSGFNVYPSEIEDVVSMMEEVLEVGAVGVPDEYSSEAVKLFIVRKNENLTREEVKAYCRKNLAGYKNPKYIEFVRELPKTNVGKILRRKLRELELTAPAAGSIVK
ncbi:MAG TPA: AMP-binding protein [Cyclobacteriaceae bacterium]|nr:AMP-binding protein [Cyclobacteriaceae bacterium]